MKRGVLGFPVWVIVLLALVALLGMPALLRQQRECERRGGVLVQAPFGYQCAVGAVVAVPGWHRP
jgi:hypothetical protein